jgi:hypothetical protein
MRTIKTYRKVGAFYIAWEEDFSTVIGTRRAESQLPVSPSHDFDLMSYPPMDKEECSSGLSAATWI